MLKKALSSEAIEDYKKFQQQMQFATTFEFLRAHNGIRQDGLHGLGGVMSSGKSSLFQKIICDTAENAKVHLHLSEETQTQYQSAIADVNPYVLNNISFCEERTIPLPVRRSHDEFCAYFTDMVIQSDCKVCFIDNVTTSRFYAEGATFGDYDKTAQFLFDFPKKHNVAIFYLAHYNKHITKNFKRMTTPEDIRGSNALPIRTEYFYCLNTFEWETEIHNIVETAKHRGHKGAKGTWLLNWMNQKYYNDTPVDFNRIKEIFKGRNRL